MTELKIEAKTSLTHDDIVAMHVASAEARIHTELAEAKAQVKALKAEVAAADKDISAKLLTEAKKVTAKKAAEAAKAIRSVWGIKVVPRPTVSVPSYVQAAGHAPLAICHLDTPFEEGCSFPGFDADLPKTAVKAWRDGCKQRVEKEAEMQKLADQICELQGRLTKLPALERQIRAKLVAKVIGESENGAELMKELAGVTLPALGFDG